MTKKPPLTIEQADIIVDHIAPMLDAVNEQLAILSHGREANEVKYVRNQLIYWKHVRGALEWATATAKQRVKHVNQ